MVSDNLDDKELKEDNDDDDLLLAFETILACEFGGEGDLEGGGDSASDKVSLGRVPKRAC